MATKTHKKILSEMLESLGKNCFKKFRVQLCDRRQEPRVRLGQVEDGDVLDIASLMVRTFTEKGAIEVAIEVLKDIDCNEEAEELEKVLKPGGTKKGAGGHAGGKYMVGEQHFVDAHRKALIQRVRTLAPIFDDLLEKKVIKQETYDDLKAEPTPPKKMRALFDTAISIAGPRVKDIFYEILEEHEEFLLLDLKGE